MRALFIISLFIIGLMPSQAQQPGNFCGTPSFVSESLEAWRANRPHAQLRSVQDTLYMKLKVHLVGTDEGTGYYPLSSLFASFCKLNEDMVQAGIQLEMDPEINYIPKSVFNDHSRIRGRQMMSFHNVDNMVNCYIVANPAGACGYYSPDGDAIALSKNCLGKFNTTWAHEIGHYFSLPHTFNGWEGIEYEYGNIAPNRVGQNNVLVEKTDNSNCAIAGDKFCDTPPDYLSYRWNCSGSTSPDTLMDPDSSAFLVDGTYLMSYSNDACANIFSDEQKDAMRFNIEFGRTNEISQNPLPGEVNFDRNEFTVYSGKDGEDLQYDDVNLIWSAVPNATQYLVQITKKSFFPGPPDYVIFTQDTFLNLDYLLEDTRYEWDVFSFNKRYTCSSISQEYEFYATSVTASNNPALDRNLNVYPNPLTENDQLIIEYQAPMAIEGHIEIFNLNGSKVHEQKVNWPAGGSKIKLTHLPLTSGVYIMKYHDQTGFASRKLLIQ